MKLTILNDSKQRPELFTWNDHISEPELVDWLGARCLSIPEDLKLLWLETGGGNVLESESILGPFGDKSMGDDIESVNSFHRNRGMPDRYLIFRVGLGGISTLRETDQRYVVLDQDTYSELHEYGSLEDWYLHGIRNEYAERYGLSHVD